jgi:hypothetical protein
VVKSALRNFQGQISCGIFLAFLLTGQAFGQQATAGGMRPVGRAFPLESVPVIDGDVLNDPAWTGVVPLTGFIQTQPDAGQPASQRTEVFIGFSDSAIHIGVVAYDSNPEGIIATDSRRDSSLDDTDSFRVLIDGLLDRQNGFVFGTNPAGIEFDGQVTREGTGQNVAGGDGGLNKNWDAPWTVKALVGEFGWSAEMRIPFSSLRYGIDDVQSWGFNFERRIRRNNEIAYWAPMSQDRDLLKVSEAGTVEGIRAPRQRTLLLTPYVLGKWQQGGELPNSENEQDFGIDLKYSITPSLTLDATYNTDFAQVEVDEQQVNLDRFNLFFPEKRPFFLENAGQFTVGNPREVELFFSRRIGIADGSPVPIDGGLRLSGKIGGTTNVGLLYMASEAAPGLASANNYTVARISQEFANRSSVGFLYVDRDGDGSLLGNGDDDQNQTYAVDGSLGIGENGLVRAWAAKTETPGLNGDDTAFSLTGDYNNADWSVNLGYAEVGANFNPEVGFLARTDYRRIDGRIMRRYRPDNRWNLFELRPHISYRGFWDSNDFQETGFLHVDNHWEFVTGTEIHTGINFTREGVKDPFEIVDGVFVQPGTYDENELQLVLMGNQSAPLNFSLQSIIGGRFGGDRLTLTPTLRYRIGEKFSSEFNYVYNEFDLPVPGGSFTANLARIRLSFSFTPRILLQLLAQYNEQDDRFSTNLRFSWLQSANAGLYVVYNEVDERGIGAPPRGKEFIIKYSRIFDVFR